MSENTGKESRLSSRAWRKMGSWIQKQCEGICPSPASSPRFQLQASHSLFSPFPVLKDNKKSVTQSPQKLLWEPSSRVSSKKQNKKASLQTRKRKELSPEEAKSGLPSSLCMVQGVAT